ncbi:MAG TPA: hypothetical protein PKI14_03865 [Fervidobacterium sp.]|nr:hypothetical protein [Fervidobacterium sp.]HOQ39408.1 hypothetical protein [Fervidobacterium sp.]HPT53355.1 hypothetical protein [Fervidobacterium sp.]HPZ16905.1 hypothetical protein [Fervidobacterium sp.]HQE47902.1 hypothetical protein [Fervidobacterium sp.]
MIQVVGIALFIAGIYINIKVNNIFISKLVQLFVLISLGYTLKNQFIIVLFTVFLLISRNLYTPIGIELIDDLKRFLFAKTMLRNTTYLMLVITGGIFVGFSLPAVKSYSVTIIITTAVALLLIYVVELSNYKSFEEKIKRASEKSTDPIEAIKYAYELMHPLSQANIEETIKNRVELFASLRNRDSEKSSVEKQSPHTKDLR